MCTQLIKLRAVPGQSDSRDKLGHCNTHMHTHVHACTHTSRLYGKLRMRGGDIYHVSVVFLKEPKVSGIARTCLACIRP